MPQPADPLDHFRVETQEERALRALEAIKNGGDVTAEAFRLSNEFTDRHTARLADWMRTLLRRG
ncbi:hypothetical protein ABC304_09870 [Microbacterium sp. 1P10UB]|uniref:hypothetical protein n=1 Tax=unclassified Microbacterium TaxID=2609290 RepID=UPI0039A33164